MNSSAIRKAIQFSYKHRRAIFHVHRHEHKGMPQFSPIDLSESAKFIPNFWNVQPNLPHGIIVLSYDSMAGLCWHPSYDELVSIDQFSVMQQTEI